MSSRGGVPSFVVGAIAGAVCSAAVICLYQNTTTFTKCRAALNLDRIEVITKMRRQLIHDLSKRVWIHVNWIRE